MIDRYLGAYEQAVDLKVPPDPTPEQVRWRNHDWWDRPMAYTEIPPKPKTLRFDDEKLLVMLAILNLRMT